MITRFFWGASFGCAGILQGQGRISAAARGAMKIRKHKYLGQGRGGVGDAGRGRAGGYVAPVQPSDERRRY